jgi:hypothetical protein
MSQTTEESTSPSSRDDSRDDSTESPRSRPKFMLESKITLDDIEETIPDLIDRISIPVVKEIAERIYYDLENSGICILEPVTLEPEISSVTIKNVFAVPAQGSPIFLDHVSYINTKVELLEVGLLTSISKIIKKTYRVNNLMGTSVKEKFSVLYEIVCQQYAYELIEADHELKKWIVIPKIYEIRWHNLPGDTEKEIEIFMQYIYKIDIVDEWYDNEWQRRIHVIFKYFQENGLFHLDSAHRNFYFTRSDGNLKLALIDYGQSQISTIRDNSIFTAYGQSSGYPSYQRFVNKTPEEINDMITRWLNGIGVPKVNWDRVDMVDVEKMVAPIDNTTKSSYGGKKSKRKHKSKRKSKRKLKRNRK